MSDFDRYLNVCKPKTVPVKTAEQIFQHVVRAMHRQGGPCAKVNDTTQVKTPVTFTTFRGKLHVSPLLSFFAVDELTRVQRTVGFDLLQRMRAWEFSYLEASESNKEAVAKVKGLLEEKGIPPSSWHFLMTLEEKAFVWAAHCASLPNYSDHQRTVFSHLYNVYSPLAVAFSFDHNVLNFYQP